MSQAKTKTAWQLTSASLRDAYTDFILDHQARNHTQATLEFYKYTAGFFLVWIEQQNVTTPEEVTARLVRQYVAELVARGLKDTTVWDHARAIKTMLRFWLNEGYIQQPVKFELPKMAKKRLPVLTAEQLRDVLRVCKVRDKAIVLFLADSGLRRAEAIKLNWCDVDMQTGRVQVKQGKGQKDRTAVIGALTRRALLKYRRTVADHSDNAPIFQTDEGTRFTGNGMLAVFRRLQKRTGIHVNPHAMRRTFAILSLRAGMSPLHLQNLGGWESLEMVQHYAQMDDFDLMQEHRVHSPVDNLDRLKG